MDISNKEEVYKYAKIIQEEIGDVSMFALKLINKLLALFVTYEVEHILDSVKS